MLTAMRARDAVMLTAARARHAALTVAFISRKTTAEALTGPRACG